jgi:hypothetical protein
MKTNISRTVTRLSKLNPGDLFVFTHDKSFYIALLVVDPLTNDKLALPLGPNRFAKMKYASLMAPRLSDTVISFGNDYQLTFPSGTNGWTDEQPRPEDYCLLLSDNEIYIRADFGTLMNHPIPYLCYVDLRTGRIKIKGEGQSAQFAMINGPEGSYMFLTEWAFFTVEKEPQQIVAFSPS